LLKLFDFGLVSNYLALNRWDQIFETHLPVGAYEVLLASLEIGPLFALCGSAWNLRPGLHFTWWPRFFLPFCVNKLRKGHLITLPVVLGWCENIAFVDNSADIAAIVQLLLCAIDKRLAVLNASRLR
jgi:hypothetical protein